MYTKHTITPYVLSRLLYVIRKCDNVICYVLGFLVMHNSYVRIDENAWMTLAVIILGEINLCVLAWQKLFMEK